MTCRIRPPVARGLFAAEWLLHECLPRHPPLIHGSPFENLSTTPPTEKNYSSELRFNAIQS